MVGNAGKSLFCGGDDQVMLSVRLWPRRANAPKPPERSDELPDEGLSHLSGYGAGVGVAGSLRSNALHANGLRREGPADHRSARHAIPERIQATPRRTD